MAIVHVLAFPQVLQLSTTIGTPLMNYPVNNTDIHLFSHVRNDVQVLIKDVDRKPVLLPTGSVPVIQIVDPKTLTIMLEKDLTLVDASQALWYFFVDPTDFPDWTPCFLSYTICIRSSLGILSALYTDKNYTPNGTIEVFDGPLPRPRVPIIMLSQDYVPRNGNLYTITQPGAATVLNPSGQHSAVYYVTTFYGSITVQASIESTPPTDDSQWATVGSEAFTGNTGTYVQSFTGNFLWVRFVVMTIDGGTVDKIVYSV
jgi:hypothetical protein